MSARSFRRERTRAIRREERCGAQRSKRVAMAAGGLFALAAVAAPAANAAGFVVNSAADGGATACDTDCTLRDAVEAANATPAADVITFANGLAGPIQLNSSIQITNSSLEIR